MESRVGLQWRGIVWVAVVWLSSLFIGTGGDAGCDTCPSQISELISESELDLRVESCTANGGVPEIKEVLNPEGGVAQYHIGCVAADCVGCSN